MTSFRRLVSAVVASLVVSSVGVSAPSVLASTGPDDVIAVVVDGVGTPGTPGSVGIEGTPADPDQGWTRILDADVLADRYSLGALWSATMVASSQGRALDTLVLVGRTGRTVRLDASAGPKLKADA